MTQTVRQEILSDLQEIMVKHRDSLNEETEILSAIGILYVFALANVENTIFDAIIRDPHAKIILRRVERIIDQYVKTE